MAECFSHIFAAQIMDMAWESRCLGEIFTIEGYKTAGSIGEENCRKVLYIYLLKKEASLEMSIPSVASITDVANAKW